MTHIFQVSERVFRGPRPDEETYRELANRGIKTVINCEGGFIETLTQNANLELKWAIDNHIDLFFLDCNAVFFPSKQAIENALAILTNNFYGKVFVHCKKGVDRTGVLIACLRMHYGATYQEAKDEMIQMGFHLFPYSFWLPSLKKLEGNLK